MITRTGLSFSAALGLLVLVLTGCADSPPRPSPERVEAAIQSLGGTPDNLYQQEVLLEDLGTGQYVPRMVFLVPAKNGVDARIVDTDGAAYANYDDFVRNNSWPTLAQDK